MASKIANSNGQLLTNGQLAGSGQNAATDPIYFVGLLDADQGIVLAPGSVTDLSGTSIRDPYATVNGVNIVSGRMVDGGSITTLPSAALAGQTLFQFQPQLPSVYAGLAIVGSSANGITQTGLSVVQVGRDMTLDSGSTLNLSGASDVYDQPVLTQTGLRRGPSYAPTQVWSNGGTLSAGANLTISGATILAQGGAPQAQGGTLEAVDPVLAPARPGHAGSKRAFRRYDHECRLRYAGRLR